MGIGVPTVADRIAQTVVRVYLELGGTGVPPRLLRLSARAIGTRCT